MNLQRSAGRVLAAMAAAMALVPALTTPSGAQTPPTCSRTVPCRLSAGLPEARVLNVVVSPDGERAVFLHTSDSGVQELYSVPVQGGAAPTRLDVPAADRLGRFVISPDSSRVLYLAPLGPDGTDALFSVPIAGPASANVRLANTLRNDFQVSPDSRKVVLATPTGDRLRAVPIAGPANAGVRLTDPFAAPGVRFGVSANSGSVVYTAQQDAVGVSELYRVPLTLSPPPDPVTTKLNGPLAVDGDVTSFQLAADDGPVVYRADQDANDVFELYSVRLGGAGRVKLSRPLAPGWDVFDHGVLGGLPFGYQVLPDGSRVVYEIQNSIGTARELYSVPTAGPASGSVRLDAPPSGFIEFGYQVTGDSERVVYVVGSTSGAVQRQAYSVPVAGPAGGSDLVTFPSPTGHQFTLSPDGDHVVWELDENGTLFRTDIAGPLFGSVRINGAEDPGLTFVDPASERVVYLAPQPGFQSDLFSVPIEGDGTRYNLTRTLDAQFIPTGFGLTAEHVVYPASPDFEGFHLYSSRLVPT